MLEQIVDVFYVIERNVRDNKGKSWIDIMVSIHVGILSCDSINNLNSFTYLQVMNKEKNDIDVCQSLKLSSGDLWKLINEN